MPGRSQGPVDQEPTCEGDAKSHSDDEHSRVGGVACPAIGTLGDNGLALANFDFRALLQLLKDGSIA
jgi:hypothetical protein